MKMEKTQKNESGQAVHSVSIVICTYNRAESLRETLESLMNQRMGSDPLSCEPQSVSFPRPPQTASGPPRTLAEMRESTTDGSPIKSFGDDKQREIASPHPFSAGARNDNGLLTGVFSYEILVVDNNSTDKTRAVVEECVNEVQNSKFKVQCKKEKSPGSTLNFELGTLNSIRYIFEPRQGIAYARNTGVENSRGDVIAFLDDDVLVSPEWLISMIGCFRETHAGAVGGQIQRKWLTQPPDWYTEELGGCLISQEWGDERKQWKSRMRHMVTANFAVRRSVLDRLGKYREELGRRGDELTGGEDREYYQRLIDANIPVYYEPKALVYHKVEPERLTPDYFTRWFRDVGKTLGHQMEWKWHFALTLAPLWLWKSFFRSVLAHRKANCADVGTIGKAGRFAARMWMIHYGAMLQERWVHWRGGANSKGCVFGGNSE